MLVEASTESEWVAQHLETLGHEVIVAEPNFEPMYATRLRRTKTDRRDARTLMEACRLGAYPPAYRLSDAAVVATVDDIKRFASAHHFEAARSADRSSA